MIELINTEKYILKQTFHLRLINWNPTNIIETKHL